ncbi:uncharacterized protein LOC111328155 [Stylophora pistillata]|uniref:uncharacterized protein LOC111328155 n=1 Tax=Stylophora pistillata TaxID=50429 RepID=UPI000C04F61C|nr:uncharacterized protein LOC111328155 [Stylophora pistillata]
MSSFLPSIDTVRKSSLVSAKRIYSNVDSMVQTSSNGRTGKQKKRRNRELSTDDQMLQQKVDRTKKYSQELKLRKDEARIAREESLVERENIKALKEMGLREKKRLNQLFSVYAVQQGSSYRDSAKVVKPKFPVMLKSTKSTINTAMSCEKISYSHNPFPNLTSDSRRGSKE